MRRTPVILAATFVGVLVIGSACSSSTEAGTSGTVPRQTCSAGAELVCNGDGVPSNPNNNCQCLVRCTFGKPGSCKADECCSSIQDSTFTWCSPKSRNGIAVICEAAPDAGLDASNG